MDKRGIRAFLQARGIAIVGASENNPFSVSLLQNLKAFGFPSDALHLVNPRRKQIFDAPCRASVAEIPAAVDLAVLLVRRERVPQALKDCIAKKICAAVVVASGFAERDDEGRRLEREIRQLGEGRIAIIGPNSMGFVAPGEKLVVWCSPLSQQLASGSVTAIFHSSGMLNLFLQQCAERRVGIRYGWAPGNETTVTMTDCLREAVEDEKTRVIALVLEHVGDRREFSALLDRAAASNKPVVILRLGRSPQAAKAVQAHTGRLGSPSRAWSAFARQMGAILVDTLDDLIEHCVLFSRLEPKRAASAADGLGLITISGGDCSLLMDLCADIGLNVPEPSSETRLRISEAMSKPLSLVNPLDIEDLWSARPESFKNAVRCFAEDPAFRIVACRFNMPKAPSRPLIEMYEGAAQAIRAAGKEPVFLTRASEQLDDQWFGFFDRLATPFLLEYRKSLRAIQNHIDFVHREPRGPSPSRELSTKASAFKALLFELRRQGKKTLPYSQAKSLLEAYGARFAAGGVAATEEDALGIAEKVGYPVAMKILSADLPHKTESRAIVLGVASPEQLSSAYRELHTRIRKTNPPFNIEGVLVQSMIANGVEIMAGIFQDSLLGPAVLVGMGGIYTEILDDVSIRIPPISRAESEAMIHELRSSPILTGARGKPPCDVGALAELLVGLGELAVDFSDIVDAVDLNPVMVRAAGGGLAAVDVLVTLKEDEGGIDDGLQDD